MMAFIMKENGRTEKEMDGDLVLYLRSYREQVNGRKINIRESDRHTFYSELTALTL